MDKEQGYQLFIILNHQSIISGKWQVQGDSDKAVNVTPNETEQLMGSLFFMSMHGLPHSKILWRT
jgi:hypothetical protein